MFFFCCFLDKKILYNHFKNKFISMSLYLFFKSNYMFMFLKHVQWDLSISFDLKNIGFFSSWKFRFQVMDCVCFFKKISHENIYISQFSLSEKGRFPLQNGEITFMHEYMCLVLENATIFQGMQESGNLAKWHF
jgi:hypothetical protein